MNARRQQETWDQYGERVRQMSVLHLERLNASPLQEIAVHNPNDCPFKSEPRLYVIYSEANPPDKCTKCRENGGQFTEILGEPELHRIQYDTRQCLKEKAYREAIKQSGLIGNEVNHKFNTAILDKHNGQLYKFLQTWDTRKPAGIYIYGDRTKQNPGGNGTGKSYVLHCLVNRFASAGRNPIYAQTVELLQEIRATYQDGAKRSEDQVLYKYKNADILLLDDFGKERLRDPEWAGEKFYFIIDYRIRAGLPLVIASNFTLPEIEIHLQPVNKALPAVEAGRARPKDRGGLNAGNDTT